METPRSFPAFSALPSTTSRIRRAGLDSPALIVLLVGMDAVALGASFALAYVVRFKIGLPFLETPPHLLTFYSSVVFWAIPVWLTIFSLYRLYDRHYLFAGFHEYTRVINACTVGMLALIGISFLDKTLIMSRGWLLLTWFLAVCLVGGSRFGFRRLLRLAHRHDWLLTPTVIVGANDEGKALAQQFLENPSSGTRILGFIDDTLPIGASVIGTLKVVGTLGDLEKSVHDREVREVVIATTALTRDHLLDVFRAFGHDEGVELRLSSGLFEILTTGVRVQEVSCVPLMTPQRVRITEVDAFMKMSLDYVGAAIGLLVLSPILLGIAVLVKLDSPGPIFHRRRVLGRGGKPFDAFKFRTMVVNADEVLRNDPDLYEAFIHGYKLKVDPRVTRIGRALRRTSLDELPQLINVLRGEMSLVGPRMISPDEATRYGKWQLNLLTVKPGITGPWQVQGRSEIPYDERVRLSMHYIRNYSIWLDLGILLRTVMVVVRGEGAY